MVVQRAAQTKQCFLMSIFTYLKDLREETLSDLFPYEIIQAIQCRHGRTQCPAGRSSNRAIRAASAVQWRPWATMLSYVHCYQLTIINCTRLVPKFCFTTTDQQSKQLLIAHYRPYPILWEWIKQLIVHACYDVIPEFKNKTTTRN